MTDTGHDAETEMLEALARDLAAMPARIKRAREIEQAANAKTAAAEEAHRIELAAHQAAIDEAVQRHRADVAKREREVLNRENAVTTRENELKSERVRIADRERAVENRLADAGQRYRQGAA